MKSKIKVNFKEGMGNQDNLFQLAFVVFLLFLLFCNLGGFFFFKNTSRDLRLSLIRIDKDILEENKKLSFVRAEFNKKYNTNKLQNIAKEKTNLQLSTINQVVDIQDIL